MLSSLGCFRIADILTDIMFKSELFISAYPNYRQLAERASYSRLWLWRYVKLF